MVVVKEREKKKKLKWSQNQEWSLFLEVGKRGAYELKEKKASVSGGEEERLTKTNAMCCAMHSGF